MENESSDEPAWDNTRVRGDTPWVTALVCPVLIGLNIAGGAKQWNLATQAHETGHDFAAEATAVPQTKPVDGFKSASKELSNALVAFVFIASLIVVGLGGLTLKLPGEPAAPVLVAVSFAMLLFCSALGWQVGEMLTGKSFSKAFGESTAAVCRILIPHAVIGWIIFVVAMIGIYSG